jgi:transposase-like protein
VIFAISRIVPRRVLQLVAWISWGRPSACGGISGRLFGCGYAALWVANLQADWQSAFATSIDHKPRNPSIPMKPKNNPPRHPQAPAPAHAILIVEMGHTTDNPPLTSVQQCVVDALAAGSTLTDTAETYGVHRVTIYRWMKTSKPFIAALHRARAEFVLARRDDLHHLSNRALETLLAVLDNPKASPAVQLRAAMFILQRPQLPKTGWSMPEPAPDPDGKKLLDSAIIEQDYDSLPGLCNIEREDPAETPAEEESPAESIASDAPPPPESPAPPAHDRSPCNQMQHDFEICDDVASAPSPRRHGLHSCPVPPAVLKARNDRQNYLELLDMIKSIEQTPIPKIEDLEKDDPPAEANAKDREETLA